MWTHCIDPLVPEGKNLEVAYSHPINFNAHVSYGCVEGTWFEEDKEKEEHLVQCKTTGKFAYPGDWPACVSSEYSSLFNDWIELGFPLRYKEEMIFLPVCSFPE